MILRVLILINSANHVILTNTLAQWLLHSFITLPQIAFDAMYAIFKNRCYDVSLKTLVLDISSVAQWLCITSWNAHQYYRQLVGTNPLHAPVSCQLYHLHWYEWHYNNRIGLCVNNIVCKKHCKNFYNLMIFIITLFNSTNHVGLMNTSGHRLTHSLISSHLWISFALQCAATNNKWPATGVGVA